MATCSTLTSWILQKPPHTHCPAWTHKMVQVHIVTPVHRVRNVSTLNSHRCVRYRDYCPHFIDGELSHAEVKRLAPFPGFEPRHRERQGCATDLESPTQAGCHSGGAGVCRALPGWEELCPHIVALKPRILPGPRCLLGGARPSAPAFYF